MENRFANKEELFRDLEKKYKKKLQISKMELEIAEKGLLNEVELADETEFKFCSIVIAQYLVGKNPKY